MLDPSSLSDFAADYVQSRDLSKEYAARLLTRARAFQSAIGEQSASRLLTESNANRFLASLQHLAPRTVLSYREDLLTLWLAAADDGLVAYPVTRRIRRARCPQLLVECYTADEARAILSATRLLGGRYPNGVPRPDYWQAAIRLAWDAGLRRGDVWSFRRDAIRPDGVALVCQRKTGQAVTVRLRPSTIDALVAIGSRTPCAWPLTASRFGRHFRRLTALAGVGRGSFKWLRRASGSYVEAAQPGAGHKHLGNGAALFARHYDARLGAAAIPLPPEL